MFTFIKNYKKPIFFALISTLTYFVFFYKVLNPNLVLYSGKDSVTFHYPSRAFLYQSLHSGFYPFYTQRLFGGFPIFLDLERQYLNPLNVMLVYLTGPELSFKLLHFLTYFVGSLGLYAFLKSYKHSQLGIMTANVVYFFSFFMLFHQQHFSMVQAFYLLPLLLYLTKRQTKFMGLLLAYIFYLGNFQSLLLIGLTQLVYVLTQKFSIKNYAKNLVLFGLCILPVLYPLYNLYTQSSRASTLVAGQGLFSPSMIVNLVVPFLYQRGDAYMGVLINSEFLMQETYIYIGITAIIVSIFSFTKLNEPRLRKFLGALVWLFLILAFVNLPILPFSAFRYWVRSSLLISLVLAFLVSHLLSLEDVSTKINWHELKFLLYPTLFMALVELVQYFRFHNQTSVTMLRVFLRPDYHIESSLVYWPIFVLATLILLSTKNLNKFLIAAVISVDLIYFGTLSLQSAFASKNVLIPTQHNGDTTLYFNQKSLLGYSVFAPQSVTQQLKDLGFKNTRYIPDGVDASLVNFDEPDNNTYDYTAFLWGLTASAIGIILYILKK